MFQRFCRIVATFAVLVSSLAGCAHFSDIDDFPQQYRARLAKHPVWLTITSFDNAPGAFPPAEVSVVKKWEAHKAPDGAVVLRQISSSSFMGTLEALYRDRPLFPQIDVEGDVDPRAFFPFPGHALDRRRRFKADRYEFVDLDGKRFQIRINGGIGRIVFLPAPNNYFVAGNPYEIPDVGIWTTPFGAESEIYAHLRRLMQKSDTPEKPIELPGELIGGQFLHHDVTIKKKIPVIVDRTFPEALRPVVPRAVAKWNQAFGKELFEVFAGTAKIETADCISGRKLCIRWIGPKELSFTGANGYTELAFDPQTGLVVGGIISVINDDVKPPFSQLPEADRAKLRRLDRDWIADAMLRFNEMNDVAHPVPEGSAEYLLLHEMGHFSGLGHNFYVSDSTTPLRPVSTIMSYPPFPVAHRATYIGEADLTRLGIVYGQKRPDEKDLEYCSTFEAMTPERDKHGYFVKAARCDIFTVGSPADWYIQLARRGGEGVFTPFPDLSHLSAEMQELYHEVSIARRLPPLNVLTRLGLVLGDTSPANSKTRARIEDYLCGLKAQRTAIAAQLKTFHGVGLKCT